MGHNLCRIERKTLYKELKPLFESLSSIRYAVIKGEVLSQQIYGIPDKRNSSDIDILIDRKNVKFLEERLQELGFKQKSENDTVSRRNRILCMTYSHQIPSYHKNSGGFHLNVDVNYDIFWGEYEGKRCSIDAFLSDTIDMEIYGVIVKTLPIEKAFVQLVLHHYKEMNSLYHLSCHNCIRASMFKDIYDFVCNRNADLNLSSIHNVCNQYVIGSYVYYMLYYTNLVFESEFLSKYVDQIGFYRDNELLDSYGLSSKERKKWKIPFENRIDNDNIWHDIAGDMTYMDVEKIIKNKLIFD